MGALVYTSTGADEASPCPTTASMFWEGEKCTRGDYANWRRAAAQLYELGLLPTWERLLEVGGTSNPPSEALLRDLVEYKASYLSLPPRGSAWSPNRNANLISNALALMLKGEAVIGRLRTAFIERGALAPPLQVPAKPAVVEAHSAWRAYAWYIGIGSAGLTVTVLTVWAILSARGGK